MEFWGSKKIEKKNFQKKIKKIFFSKKKTSFPHDDSDYESASGNGQIDYDDYSSRAHTLELLIFTPTSNNDLNLQPEIIELIYTVILEQIKNGIDLDSEITGIFGSKIVDHIDLKLTLIPSGKGLAHSTYHNLLCMNSNLGQNFMETQKFSQNAYAEFRPDIIIGPADTESINSLLYMTHSSSIPMITVGPLTNKFKFHQNSKLLTRVTQSNDQIAHFFYELFTKATNYAEDIHYFNICYDGKSKNDFLKEAVDDVYDILRSVASTNKGNDSSRKNYLQVTSLLKEAPEQAVHILKARQFQLNSAFIESQKIKFKNDPIKLKKFLKTIKNADNNADQLPPIILLFGDKNYVKKFLKAAKPYLNRRDQNVIYWVDVLEETRPQMVEENLEKFKIFDEKDALSDQKLEKFLQILTFSPNTDSKLKNDNNNNKSFYKLFKKRLKEENLPFISNRFVDGYYDAFRLLFKMLDNMIIAKSLATTDGEELTLLLKSNQFESANGNEVRFRPVKNNRVGRLYALRNGYWGRRKNF